VNYKYWTAPGNYSFTVPPNTYGLKVVTVGPGSSASSAYTIETINREFSFGGSDSTINLGTNNYSLRFWIYPRTTSGNIVSIFTESTIPGFDNRTALNIGMAERKVSLYAVFDTNNPVSSVYREYNNFAGPTGSTSFSPTNFAGQWNYIEYTKIAGYGAFYINGVLKFIDANSFPLGNNNILNFGRFNGYLSNVTLDVGDFVRSNSQIITTPPYRENYTPPNAFYTANALNLVVDREQYQSNIFNFVNGSYILPRTNEGVVAAFNRAGAIDYSSGAGGMAWTNYFPCLPGQTYPLQVGNRRFGPTGGVSSFGDLTTNCYIKANQLLLRSSGTGSTASNFFYKNDQPYTGTMPPQLSFTGSVGGSIVTPTSIINYNPIYTGNSPVAQSVVADLLAVQGSGGLYEPPNGITYVEWVVESTGATGTNKPPNGISNDYMYWTVPGEYNFTVPNGVNGMSAIVIGSGAASDYPGSRIIGGGGGGIAWCDRFFVKPGENLWIGVGDSFVRPPNENIDAMQGVNNNPGSARTSLPRYRQAEGLGSTGGMWWNAPNYGGSYAALANSILPRNLSTYGIGGTSHTRTNGMVLLMNNNFDSPQYPGGGGGIRDGYGYRYWTDYTKMTTFTVPPGVTYINVVCKGPSNSYRYEGNDFNSNPANAAWANKIPVTPGSVLSTEMSRNYQPASWNDHNVPFSKLTGPNIEILANGPPGREYYVGHDDTRGSYVIVPSGVQNGIDQSANQYSGGAVIARQVVPDFDTYGMATPGNWFFGTGLVYIEWPLTEPNLVEMPRVISTFAGGNGPGLDDGGMMATYDASSITRDPVNNVLYLADPNDNRIRKMVQNNGVWESSILAGSDVYDPATSSFTAGYLDSVGTNARFNRPNDVYYYNNRAYSDDSHVYVADTKNHAIRKIKTSFAIVTTLAGGSGPGFVDGPAASAKFDSPESLTVGSDGAVYVADTGNNCIRKIYNGVVSTYEANFARPTKICFGANGKLYVTGSQGVKLLL
jgi:hypothetical protein